MRILMLAQFYHPIIGGEESHVRTLSTELVRRGHQVTVITSRQEGIPEFEVAEGVRIYRIKGAMSRLPGLFSESQRRHAPPFPDPELTLNMRRIIALERPEIIHAHNWFVYSFLPLKKWSDAKLVMTLHDYSLACANKNLMYMDSELCSGPGPVKCFGCAVHRYGKAKGVVTTAANWLSGAVERHAVDMYLAVSEATADGNGITSDKYPLRIIPNFLADERGTLTEDVSPYLDQLPEEDFMLFVGDLRLFKGIDILLKAYAGLDNAPPLVLIGRECADTPTSFPPNVYVLNSWPRPAVLQAWQRSLFGLLPSIGPETFGIAVIEAMAEGRPVIASRIGGLPDIVKDGQNGFLVPPGDVEALRQALSRLLQNPLLRERMGQVARQQVGQFRANKVVPRIEQVYQELVQERELVPVPLFGNRGVKVRLNVNED